MARQQLKNQVEQEFVNLIDNVESRNLSPTKKDEVYTAFAKKASNILGEKMNYVGDVNGSGEKIITNEDGKMALVPNPHYLDQLERLNVPNTTQIDWSRQPQNQQQIPQEQQQIPQDQQQPNQPHGTEIKPNTTYRLPDKNGNLINLTTDENGHFAKNWEKLHPEIYTKLYEDGYIPDPKEVPTGAINPLTNSFLEQIQEIPKSVRTIQALDKMIENAENNPLQGWPKPIADMVELVDTLS